MGYQFITDQDRAKRNLRELQRLEQHQFNIHLLLVKVKTYIFRLKLLPILPQQELQQHQVPQHIPTVFQRRDIVQITNYLRDEFGIFCEVILKVFNNNYRVYLKITINQQDINGLKNTSIWSLCKRV